MDAATLRARCAAKIAARKVGHFHDRPWLYEAFLSVPREHFVPDVVWWPVQDDAGRFPVLDRTAAPDPWLQAVYDPRTPLITQIADGAVRPEDGPTDRADFTSSISCAAVVVDMLHHLDPQEPETVLEIGTGTGYSAALLSRRVRADHVVTVEISPELADHADHKLDELGVRPLVVTGDGELGWAPRAPYDRVLSTVAVRRVPQAWLDQTTAGGTILTPLDTPFGHEALLRLVADGKGGAEGHLVTGVSFMKTRAQRPRRPYAELGWPAWTDYRVTVRDGTQRIWAPRE